MLIREAMDLRRYTDITQQTIYDHMLATAATIYDPATAQNYRRLILAAAIDALISKGDYGSTADAARDLGVIGSSAQFAGPIGGRYDAGFFSFTAAMSGTASMATTSSYHLDPAWTITNSADQMMVENGGGQVAFAVSAGQRYTLGLVSRAEIGMNESTLSINSMPVGNYDLDGVVSAADYTVWRPTLGSATDLRADASLNGIIDQTDYDLWRMNFNRTRATLSSNLPTPEPPSFVLCLAALLSISHARRDDR